MAEHRTHAPASGSNTDARIFRSFHPLYEMYINRWLEYLDFYEGEHLHKYIFRHERESRESQHNRAARIVYRNYCSPVVDLYTHYIFSKKVTREIAGQQISIQKKRMSPALMSQWNAPKSLDEEWMHWLHDVDQKEETISHFMSNMCRYAQVFGHVFILIDYPRTKQRFVNDQERQESSVRPYLSYYYPTDTPDWAIDEHGDISWIRFREPIPEDNDPFTLPDERRRRHMITGRADSRFSNPDKQNNYTATYDNVRYRTWTTTDWFLHEVRDSNVSLIASGRNPLGVVPVVILYNRETARNDFIGHSLLADIVNLNQGILNMDSLIDESVFQSVLSVLVMGKQLDGKKKIELGAKKVLEYDGERPPYFLSPSTAPLSFMEDRITRFSETINRLAKLGGGLGLQPRSVPSGVALSFEFNETNSVLADRADQLEIAEYKIHQFWYAWMKAEFHGTIDYPNDFEVKSFQEELNLIMSGQTAIRSQTYQQEMEKRVATRILKNGDPELLKRIMAEIDNTPAPYDNQQQGAPSGAAEPKKPTKEEKPPKRPAEARVEKPPKAK